MPDDPTQPPAQPSYGNMSPQHWSRTRGARNAEAIDYYRQRSQAPGVADGGAARNSYCMACDGVIPWDGFEGGNCPHCGAAVEGNTRRFFNWVEIDRAPTGDAGAVLRLLALVFVLFAVLGALVWWCLA